MSAAAMWSNWSWWCPMARKACGPTSAGSAGWSAPNTSNGAPKPGAGRPGTPRDDSKISLTEEPDHASNYSHEADVRGHDRLVGRVLGDELDVAVAALEALDGRVAVDQGHHDRAVGSLVLRPYQDQVAIQDAGVDHAVAANVEQEVPVLGQVGRKEDVVLDVLLGEDRRAGGHVADDRHGDRVASLLVC